jgi:ABC-type Mn2+/Zn2+ transport system ATPase subunit
MRPACRTWRTADVGAVGRAVPARAAGARADQPPDVLLLDEATQGLDQPGSAAFYRQIEQVRAETGCAV